MEKICEFCPRNCKVERSKKAGFCGAKNVCQISKIMFHHWEEPVISGEKNQNGSGAIFFSHCNLKCVYCQNYEISHFDCGTNYSDEELAKLFKKLEQEGALNINLVTPTHYVGNIISALKIYKPKIPIVYNTGGYDSPKMLQKLKGLVDVYLTDFKYYDNGLAIKYSSAPNYLENMRACLKVMRENAPEDVFENGLMKKGIIVRHLVLPNNTTDSIRVLEEIKNILGEKTYISLMSQYTPHGRACEFEEINRKLKPLEYKRVKNHMLELGFLNGFVQDLNSATEDYIPDFKNKKSKN